MPAKSEAQRRFLNAEFGHDWVKENHFDNEGPLPETVGESSLIPVKEDFMYRVCTVPTELVGTELANALKAEFSIFTFIVHQQFSGADYSVCVNAKIVSQEEMRSFQCFARGFLYRATQYPIPY
jgi:hypothetical protein